ncbi:MAG TPA: hypothetical protein VFS89_09905 [Nitrosospira sp.]|nr:hypothetical protein [Nitrosospira sp.]
MKTAPLPYVCLFLAGIGFVQAQDTCDRTQVKETGATDAMLTLVATVMFNPLSVPCNSLAKVLNEVTSRGETGGKNSKKDKPLDLQKAEENLRKAVSDRKYAAGLKRSVPMWRMRAPSLSMKRDTR